MNCLTLLSMSIDMFGFPVVVSNSACDLEIGTTEKNILLSIPFIGKKSRLPKFSFSQIQKIISLLVIIG